MIELMQQWGPHAILAVIGFLLKFMLGAFDKRIRAVEVRQDAIEKVQAELREKAVMRVDFLRNESRTHDAIERMNSGLARIEGMLDAGNRVAEAVNEIKNVIIEASNRRERNGDGQDVS